MALNAAEQTAQAAGFSMPEGNDLISGGDDAIRKNAVQAMAYARKAWFLADTPIAKTDNLDTLPHGVQIISNGGIAEAVGTPDAYPGVISTFPVGGSGGLQTFTSLRGGTWERMKVRGAWGQWQKAGQVQAVSLAATDDLDGLTSNAPHIVSNGVIATALALPDAYPGVLTNTPVGANGGLQTFTSLRGGTWQRFKVNRVWGSWSSTAPASSGGDSSAPARRELLQQGIYARKGGTIGTNGRGVIALRFDDYPVEFREKVLPLLKERGLPFTRVTTAERIHTEAIPATEFTEMERFSIDAGGEVWNHGTTHGDATGEAAIFTELIGSLDTLRTAMPRIPIDCFAPPGGSVSYGGYMPSNTISNYADSYGGQQVLAHHGLVTGYYKDAFYWHLDGRLKDGLNHYSADTFTYARTREYIDRARDWAVGIVLMWHSRPFDTEGRMSLADFTRFLDDLVAARDAGEVEILTVSGMAVADTASGARDDLLVQHSSTGAFSETVSYPQFRRGVCGSTRVLQATITAPAGTQVKSVVGESTKISTVPAGGVLKLYHPATLPLDMTSVRVTIDRATTDVHLYAV